MKKWQVLYESAGEQSVAISLLGIVLGPRLAAGAENENLTAPLLFECNSKGKAFLATGLWSEK